MGEPSMVVAPGIWALTIARPERAARAMMEYIVDYLWYVESIVMLSVKHESEHVLRGAVKESL